MATTKQKRKSSAGTRPKAKFPNKKKKAASPARPTDLRGEDLERAVEQFQAEPDDKRAHEQWKQVESSILAVQSS
ncbi:MAG TPA: hypothetical protein VN948_14000 [Terriglobales bacterium]|nr:hypothetical protein [Terriglobales bacterium]